MIAGKYINFSYLIVTVFLLFLGITKAGQGNGGVDFSSILNPQIQGIGPYTVGSNDVTFQLQEPPQVIDFSASLPVELSLVAANYVPVEYEILDEGFDGGRWGTFYKGNYEGKVVCDIPSDLNRISLKRESSDSLFPFNDDVIKGRVLGRLLGKCSAYLSFSHKHRSSAIRVRTIGETQATVKKLDCGDSLPSSITTIELFADDQATLRVPGDIQEGKSIEVCADGSKARVIVEGDLGSGKQDINVRTKNGGDVSVNYFKSTGKAHVWASDTSHITIANLESDQSASIDASDTSHIAIDNLKSNESVHTSIRDLASIFIGVLDTPEAVLVNERQDAKGLQEGIKIQDVSRVRKLSKRRHS